MTMKEDAVQSLDPAHETAGERRDRVGDARQVAGARRDLLGDGRDAAGGERDQDGAHRDELADLRDLAGDERDESARVRDDLADERDRSGAHRDRAAEQRDRAAEQWDADTISGGSDGSTQTDRTTAARRAASADRLEAMRDRRAGADGRALTRTDRDTSQGDRSASADERSEANADRVSAQGDRASGAAGRTEADEDRTASGVDRASSAEERRSAALDQLTGVCTRSAGLLELRREMARSLREGRSLVVAFVDADHLKETNDGLGHEAGDRLLVDLARTLSARQRSYDVIMRFGGDEFVCAMQDVSIAQAETRLGEAAEIVRAGGGGFTFGLAQLQPDDTPGTLIARADAAFYDKRHRDRRRT